MITLLNPHILRSEDWSYFDQLPHPEQARVSRYIHTQISRIQNNPTLASKGALIDELVSSVFTWASFRAFRNPTRFPIIQYRPLQEPTEEPPFLFRAQVPYAQRPLAEEPPLESADSPRPPTVGCIQQVLSICRMWCSRCRGR